MDSHAFLAEVYRRLALRYAAEKRRPKWSEIQKDVVVIEATQRYAPYLPPDKAARILDIGFGSGWFLAACLQLDYRNLSGADFGIAHKAYIRDWAPDSITLHESQDNIGEFLSDKQEQYDFIHMSHVIEHVPKYSLLWLVDARYQALKRGATLLLRNAQYGGAMREFQLLRDPGPRVRICRVQSRVLARHLRLR
jgi:2-polyprenyl-3-methyl-5-hydroxy-6-metoxy-1,4-benzoquinol methylase